MPHCRGGGEQWVVLVGYVVGETSWGSFRFESNSDGAIFIRNPSFLFRTLDAAGQFCDEKNIMLNKRKYRLV